MNAPITAFARALLDTLRFLASADGSVYSSKTVIAERSGMGRTSVYKYLRELTDAGLICAGEHKEVTCVVIEHACTHVREANTSVREANTSVREVNTCARVTTEEVANTSVQQANTSVREVNTHARVRGDYRGESSLSLTAKQEEKNEEKNPPNPLHESETDQTSRPQGRLLGEQSEPDQGPPPGRDSFETFWANYPRKAGKQAALKAWRRMTQVDRHRALTAVQSYCDAWRNATADRKQFCKHASTWLNGGCWDDDPSEWQRMAQPEKPAGTVAGVYTEPGELEAITAQRARERREKRAAESGRRA